jgi:hypothetical protein
VALRDESLPSDMLTHVVSLISHILSNSLALEEDFTVCRRVLIRSTGLPVV